VRLLLGLDDLIGLHIDVEFMAFPRLVHDLHFAEAFALLVVAFDFFDQARLGSDSGPDARDGLVSREHRGELAWGRRQSVTPSEE
jgi:hypothetical protein